MLPKPPFKLELFEVSRENNRSNAVVCEAHHPKIESEEGSKGNHLPTVVLEKGEPKRRDPQDEPEAQK